MHSRRWLTAIIALPLLLLVLLKGGRIGFVCLLLFINGVAQWEFLGMFQLPGHPARRLTAVLLGSLLLLSFCTAQRALHLCNPSGPLFILVWCLFALMLFYLFSYGQIEQLARDLALNTLGLLYLPFLLGHFVWLRYLQDGEWWVLWLLAVIFAGDTGAFYFGRTWGKRKLYPTVSPGKTWEGAVGGTVACLLAGVLLGQRWLPEVSVRFLASLSLILAVLGLLGDLMESMIKRQAQVKDAGQLLPGHGGMLDRLDSILFAVPAVVYARLFLLGI